MDLKMKIKQKKLNKGYTDDSMSSSKLVTPSKPPQLKQATDTKVQEKSAPSSDGSSEGKNKYGGLLSIPKTRNSSRVDKIAGYLDSIIGNSDEIVQEDNHEVALQDSGEGSGSNSQEEPGTGAKKKGGIRKKMFDEGLASSALYLLENGELIVTQEEELKIRTIAAKSLRDPESNAFLEEVVARKSTNTRKTKGHKAESKIDFLSPRGNFSKFSTHVKSDCKNTE